MSELIEGIDIRIEKNTFLGDESFYYDFSKRGILIHCNFYYLELNLFYSSYNMLIAIHPSYFKQYESLKMQDENLRSIHDPKARLLLGHIMDCNMEWSSYPLRIHNLILQLIEHFSKKAEISSPVCLEYLDSRQLETVSKAKEYLDSKLYDTPNLKELTKILGTNKTYIHKWFKIKYGMTMLEYHTKEKMNQALNMIQTSNKSLLEIALTLNYSNLSNFSNAFKKFYGKPPSTVIKI